MHGSQAGEKKVGKMSRSKDLFRSGRSLPFLPLGSLIVDLQAASPPVNLSGNRSSVVPAIKLRDGALSRRP